MPTMLEWFFRNALSRLSGDVRCPVCNAVLFRRDEVVATGSVAHVGGRWFCSSAHADQFEFPDEEEEVS